MTSEEDFGVPSSTPISGPALGAAFLLQPGIRKVIRVTCHTKSGIKGIVGLVSRDLVSVSAQATVFHLGADGADIEAQQQITALTDPTAFMFKPLTVGKKWLRVAWRFTTKDMHETAAFANRILEVRADECVNAALVLPRASDGAAFHDVRIRILRPRASGALGRIPVSFFGSSVGNVGTYDFRKSSIAQYDLQLGEVFILQGVPTGRLIVSAELGDVPWRSKAGWPARRTWRLMVPVDGIQDLDVHEQRVVANLDLDQSMLEPHSVWAAYFFDRQRGIAFAKRLRPDLGGRCRVEMAAGTYDIYVVPSRRWTDLMPSRATWLYWSAKGLRLENSKPIRVVATTRGVKVRGVFQGHRAGFATLGLEDWPRGFAFLKVSVKDDGAFEIPCVPQSTEIWLNRNPSKSIAVAKSDLSGVLLKCP